VISEIDFTQDQYFVGVYGYEDRNLVLTALGFYYYDCMEVFVPNAIDPNAVEEQPLFEVVVDAGQVEPKSNLTFVIVGSILVLLLIPVVVFFLIARN
jgi:hypothetical protein